MEFQETSAQGAGASYIGSTVVFVAEEESPGYSEENSQGGAEEWAVCFRMGEIINDPAVAMTGGDREGGYYESRMAEAPGHAGASHWSRGGIEQSLIP